jgi:1A family penicillin-binding protein
MGRLRKILVFVEQWYHSNFWNLHTDQSNHIGIHAAFFLQIYWHSFTIKGTQYWREFTAELDEIWHKPVDPAAKKSQLKTEKTNPSFFARIIKNSKFSRFLRWPNRNKNATRPSKDITAPTPHRPIIIFKQNSISHRVSVLLQTLRSAMAPTNRILFSYYGHLLFSLIAISVGIYGAGLAAYVFAFEDLPPVTDLVEKQQRMTTRILDRNGKLLFRIYEDENRTLIKLQDLPDHVVQATIAIEDKKFYDHYGFSIEGITRAFIANAQNEPIQGGSTITQQLVKNRLLSSERTLQRKVRELILAIQVSRTYSKEEVLEMYFNQVAYGGATYGIEEAAQLYFDKSARALSLGEASMLAGIPVAPSVYTPFGSRPELAFARQDEVLRRMVEDGYISQAQAEAAKSEVLQYRANRIDIQAPHFVMYVRELLAQKYGEKNIFQEGLVVTTTLDLNLHNEVQNLVTTEVDSLSNLNVQNGAALITTPRTGEILAMVGSTNYFNFDQDGQVNVALRPRQPGSSIKPLTYALALSRGKTPHSVIEDNPITYQIAGSRPYSPRNYDGMFRGRVTLREALASSYNIPAVKLLAEYGLEPFINLAERMGITTWQDRSRFGLSLTLGGGEVLMTDMAKAYGTFANYGNAVDLNPILEIKNAHGEVLYKNTCALEGYGCPQTRALDPRVAYQITDILSDNAARTPAFGPQSVLTIPGQQVAVKTGTTNNLRDNWTIGYTTEHVVATWVGNNDNSPMSYVASGITGASPIWNNITRLVLSADEPHVFPLPEGMITVPICAQTGTLTCRECPTTIEEVFIPGTEPSITCSAASFAPREFPQGGNQNSVNTFTRESQSGQVLEGWNSN